MKKLLLGLILLGSSLTMSQGQDVDLPEIGGTTICRCHGESCQGGNQISLRRACGRVQGTDACGGSTNC